MFLRELHIRDLRSIASADLVFTDEGGHVQPWNLVLGENGTGKSTVLRAAALVLAGRAALPAFLSDVDSWVRNGAKRAVVTARIETAGGKQRAITLELDRGASVADVLEKNKKGLALLDAALSHSARSYFTVGYGVARR
ncbi:MAG: AAA family ATPase, partial [Myxococcaceae bacterium]|nr:AAA family ATPase [Myxococcaceae bacterium]